MSRILLLSNGHGEDLSGALLAQDLQQQGHSVQALPLAGLGSAYRKADVPLLGRSHEFSTGGIGYTSLQGRLTELLQGQVLYLLRRLIRLLRHRQRFDLILVVGDVIPVIAAWLSHRPVATYLVAYSSHYEGQLRLPWPCAALLKSQLFRAVYSRDQRTAEDLSRQLQRPVTFLGNPFMDSVLTAATPPPSSTPRIGLLPGSRRPELEQNLQLLRDLEQLTRGPRPVLIGPSRKRFIGAVLDEPRPKARLWGTAAVACRCAQAGVAVLRVHDVGPIRQTLRMAAALW